MQDFPPALLNERPAGLASVGFHLQHLTGVLDRTAYLRPSAETLSEQQLAAFHAEVPPLVLADDTVKQLVQAFNMRLT